MIMSNNTAVFAFVLAAGLVGTIAAGGCAPLVSDAAPDTIAVQARDAGPETIAVAAEACAARGRKSFGPLSYRCVDAKNVPSCQQKAYVFTCNVAPDDPPGGSRTVAAAGQPAVQSASSQSPTPVGEE
jgi:hypothetical protein